MLCPVSSIDRVQVYDHTTVKLTLKVASTMINLIHMTDLFVPYTGKRPAAVWINGHRLVILSHDRVILEEDLNLLGADRLKTIKVGANQVEVDRVLGRIAQEVDSGIVIAPPNVELKDVLRNLESELPWLH